MIPARSPIKRPRLAHIVGVLHKGERDIIDAEIERVGEVELSFSVSAEIGMRRVGTLTPFWLFSTPPKSTRAFACAARRVR